ncbi:molecular chaperone [Rahnella sp. AN3-3W3]|uniref:fimbrial biogenesis chaperone n=1 Tax=Rahnella sp. AN3-3W3 TaxID=1610578 RepID=UPI000DD4E07C|nr:molecular chaperone [Rahnella sp. AN3-3W3]
MNVKMAVRLSAAALIYLMPFYCLASLVLDETRVIYPEADPQESVKVDNPTSLNFLAQAWIEDEHGREEQHFTVYPPLSRINANSTSSVRIEKIDSEKLPADRETLMWLNIKEIPQRQKADGPQLVVAFKSRIKILYRPKSIDPELHESFTKMTWQTLPGKLIVSNPTPYNITFDKVWDGAMNNPANELPANMVAPFSSLTISVPAGKTVHTVYYDIINDFGGLSEIQHVSL